MSEVSFGREKDISEKRKTIYRVIKNKENPYVMMNKTFFEDPSISMKAKGVLGYLLTKPDNWKIYRSDIIKHCTDGESSIQSAIKELQQECPRFSITLSYIHVRQACSRRRDNHIYLGRPRHQYAFTQ